MKRSLMNWVGVALLSASWLFGLSYYHQANYLVWSMFLAAGVLLLAGAEYHLHAGRLEASAALVLLVPGVWLAPWPYRMAVLLLVVGLALHVFPIPRPWAKRIGGGVLVSGMVILGQSLALLLYTSFTARSHELPWPLPDLLGGVARLLGFDAAVSGQSIGLFSMRKVHLFGATWELFFDPLTRCFLAGGLVFLTAWVIFHDSGERQGRKLAAAIGKFIGCIILWLPVRSGLLMAIYMHRALRTGYETPLQLLNQFWSPWLHALLLAGPVFLAWKFTCLHPQAAKDLPSTKALPGSSPSSSRRHPSLRSMALSAGLIFAAVTLLTAGILWNPAGRRKSGRVLVDEYHSDWEPTERPFDPNWYGRDAGYNFACIYDYCSRFYQMARIDTPLSESVLSSCDVLIVKVPTARYNPEEIDAITDFVNRGGGLMLIGEHTNVFKTGTHLNDIARRFGFTFRYDCLFGIDSVFKQLYSPPLVPHPIIQHMPPLDFAVSCSIEPGMSCGRAVICSTGLWNLPAEYHVSNFYPQVEERAEARSGAFIQLWETRAGAGRVAAFTDSTIFSNFSTFEPGKSELMLGMIEWLNHQNTGKNPRPWLIAAGLALFAASLVFTVQGSWYVLFLGAGIFAWAVTAYGVRTMHAVSLPQPRCVRPMVQVMIDRTVCDAPLSQSGFIGAQKNGFGIFEQWILRLGYFLSRRSDKSDKTVFDGDLLVLFYPHLDVSDTYRNRLVSYVASGGKVLILDSPENGKSTANSLLYPFGLTVEQEHDYRAMAPANPTLSDSPPAGGTEISETLKTPLLAELPKGWLSDRVSSFCRIRGGQPFIWIHDEPVAACVRYGKGSVTAIGIGSLFTDYNMGITAEVIPDADLRKVFELEFSLLRATVEAKLGS